MWSRHGLTMKHERLLRLEETARERKLKLTDEQIELLERFSPEFRERHIEVHYPGDLVAVDTFFVGTLKGSARCICKPCSIASAATPGAGSTRASSRSRPCR